LVKSIIVHTSTLKIIK